MTSSLIMVSHGLKHGGGSFCHQMIGPIGRKRPDLLRLGKPTHDAGNGPFQFLFKHLNLVVIHGVIVAETWGLG